MRTVLIVEDDGLVARDMARTVRRAGHLPLLAVDGCSAIREAAAEPDLVLLDLGLPDVHGEEVLDLLQHIPSTAHVPVLVVTGRTDDAVRLQERNPAGLAGVLLKPVSPAKLTEAMGTILNVPRQRPQRAYRETKEARRREVMRRLIVDGPDRLARHVYRRMCADRPHASAADTSDVLGWAEIAEWAKLEGLVSAEEVQLLCSAVEMSAAVADGPASAGHPQGTRRDRTEAPGAS